MTTRWKLPELHKPNPGAVVSAIVFLAVSSAASLITPYISKLLVDDVILAEQSWLLWPVLGGALAIYAIRSICQYFGKMGSAELGEQVFFELRNAVFGHLQGLSLEYHASADVGDHIARVQYDTFSVKQLYGGVLPSLVEFVVGVGGTAIILLVLAPKLTLLAFLALPAGLAVGWIFRDKVKPLSDRISEFRGRVYSAAYEGLSNMEAVKTYRGEETFDARVRRAGDELRDVELELARHRAKLLPTLNFGIAVVLMAVLGVGGQMALSGTLSVGTLVAYYFYVSRSLGPIRQAPTIVFGWYRARAALERIDSVLDSEDELAESTDPVPVPEGPLRIAFDSVEFAYRDRQTGRTEPALRGISFDLAPMDRIVILGPSGSGKSTTGKMVPRLFDPDRGAVTANGIPLADFALREWRGRVGYVGQEVSLFHGTIRENITFGLDEPDELALDRAVEASGVDEMIAEKDDKLETSVGEKGGKLSGGQRKRVAMARALLREPDVLVVDQFAADIEERLCRRVFEAIDEDYDLSILYLGHRTPAGFDADRVFWMEHGRLEQR